MFGLCFRHAPQQNSSPTPAPDPKPTMIDDWAVSVKPNADPTIIKKHIEKMVEVRCCFFCQLTCPACFPLTRQVTMWGLEVAWGILLVLLCSKICITATQKTTGEQMEVFRNSFLLNFGQRFYMFCLHWTLFSDFVATCVNNLLASLNTMILTERKRTNCYSLCQGGPDDYRLLVVKSVMFL